MGKQVPAQPWSFISAAVTSGQFGAAGFSNTADYRRFCKDPFKIETGAIGFSELMKRLRPARARSPGLSGEPRNRSHGSLDELHGAITVPPASWALVGF